MPYLRCAYQMKTAYNAVIHRNVPAINCPSDLSEPCSAHVQLTRVRQHDVCVSLYYTLYCIQFGENSGTKFPPKAALGELFIEK